MGKIRTRTLGLEEEEKKQKKEQKEKSVQKKATSTKVVVSQEKEETKPTEVKVKKTGKRQAKTQVRQRGKKYSTAKKAIDTKKTYSIPEAISNLKKIKYAKFDESVEVHLNVDKTGLRGEAELPFSIGKSVRVAVVSDDLLSELEKGNMNFDVLVTHPSFMPKLAKFAKVLGPKGLMPNPKAGTISPNPEELVKKFSKGVTRWKTEPKFPLIHQMIGKISSEEKELDKNISAFLKSVGRNHILGAFVKTTMSPSLRLNIEQI
ncbi:MAG: hypothetical protein HYW86_05450 [Candidatus Roizmanbacteria bacterium]|nr:MAG: hypothetical protein HYW86_05450 [Candidatus Roizmanbacteria bacterium]